MTRWGGALVIAWLACFALASGSPGAEEAPTASGGSRAWLGVFLGDAVDGGVQLVAVVPGGPAQLGGLRGGDVVLQAGPLRLLDVADLVRALDDLHPGDRVELQLLRGGRSLVKAVTLEARPEQGWPDPKTPAPLFPPRPPAVDLSPKAIGPSPGMDTPGSLLSGVVLEEIPPELRSHYGAPATAGVLVTRAPSVERDRPGLLVGDVIVRIDGEPVRTPSDLRAAAMRSGARKDALSLLVVRGRRPETILLEHSGGADPGPVPRDEDTLREEIRALEQRIEKMRRMLEARRND